MSNRKLFCDLAFCVLLKLPAHANTNNGRRAKADLVRLREVSFSPHKDCLQLIYEGFCLDFGPLNLGQTIKFCRKLHLILKGKVLTWFDLVLFNFLFYRF